MKVAVRVRDSQMYSTVSCPHKKLHMVHH